MKMFIVGKNIDLKMSKKAMHCISEGFRSHRGTFMYTGSLILKIVL